MKLTPTKHGLSGEAHTPGGIFLLAVLVFADQAFRHPLVQVILTTPVIALLVRFYTR
jgi:hypothetical protein